MKVGKLEKIRKIKKPGGTGKTEKTEKSPGKSSKKPERQEKTEKTEQLEKLVKIKDKFQVTIPNLIREIICVKEGDVLEVTVINHTIVFKPKIVIDRDENDSGFD